MLHINDLTYRIEGRVLLDEATAAISDGWKVGFIGKNGTGKSTLLQLIKSDISAESGTVSIRAQGRVGGVGQEVPAGPESLIETVMAADSERLSLLEAAEGATQPLRIAEIQTRLADIEAHSAEARAATVLAGLGFDAKEQGRPCADFSGGWRMRVALAATLFSKPDLLLLDEPTNYLDLEGAVWLEGYLRRYPYTAIIISHDRELLNKSVTHIMALENKKLTIAPGPYDHYEKRRAEHRANALASRAKQEDARRHMEKFVERFRAKASKAKQAQSRIKMLEKMTKIAIPLEDRTIPFHFPSPKMMAPPIVRMQNARLGYTHAPDEISSSDADAPPDATNEITVLRNVTLRIDQDDRVAILGANGQGKSTLVKAISGRLKPLSGGIFKSKKLNIAYFAQHQLDELHPAQSAYEHVRALMPDGTEAEMRARTAQIGFGPEKSDTKVTNLSGGEKARLLFGLITFHGPHLMILDEPTNHLDIDSREALIMALNDYEGAVLLITHDSHLAQSCVDQLWLVKDGTVERFDGDLTAYRQLVLESAKGQRRTAKPTNAGARKLDIRRAAAERRQAVAPLKKKADELERQLEKLMQRLEQIDAALAVPGLFENEIDKATQLSKTRSGIAREIEDAEEGWLLAQEEYEVALESGPIT